MVWQQIIAGPNMVVKGWKHIGLLNTFDCDLQTQTMEENMKNNWFTAEKITLNECVSIRVRKAQIHNKYTLYSNEEKTIIFLVPNLQFHNSSW
jgi:hypothetical protein